MYVCLPFASEVFLSDLPIKCIKRAKDQQMHFILYCGLQHVSTTHVAFFMVTSLTTKTNIMI